MKFETSSKPLSRCKQCNQPIIFPIVIPPVKRAATYTYNTWRIQCIFDKDLCRKCHQRNSSQLDSLRYEEVMINETLSTSGKSG